MNLYVGTSGYAYKPWRGAFYPAKISEKEMLGFYGSLFRSVEINNTFYKLPDPAVMARWTGEVAPEFRFAIKAPQKITHMRRLKNCDGELAEFFEAIRVFKKRLGPVLFQLPPNFKKDAERLLAFVKMLPRRRRVAFEFRHASWFDSEIFELLRKRNIALCIAESEETVAVPFEATADWGYLRLRRLDYTKAKLAKWMKAVQTQPWSDAFVFFRHEDTGLGPKFAHQFLALKNDG